MQGWLTQSKNLSVTESNFSKPVDVFSLIHKRLIIGTGFNNKLLIKVVSSVIINNSKTSTIFFIRIECMKVGKC